MLQRLITVVLGLVGSAANPTPPMPPKRLGADHGDERRLVVEVYQSERLTGKNGRSPEEVVAPALASAFDAAGVTYEIRRANPTISLSEDTPTSDTLAEFRDEGDRSVDTRLCLIDAPGGGKGELAGVYCVMGAANIDERFDPSLATTPLAGRERNVRGAIHEVGHTLGGRHTTPILDAAPAMQYSDQMGAQIDYYFETNEAEPRGDE